MDVKNTYRHPITVAPTSLLGWPIVTARDQKPRSLATVRMAGSRGENHRSQYIGEAVDSGPFPVPSSLSPLPSLSLSLPNSLPNPTNQRSSISLPKATPCFSDFGAAIRQSFQAPALVSQFNVFSNSGSGSSSSVLCFSARETH
ncbi:hypothetical protein TIFTF001_031518 [Ficus carica]|uniref:Uncharacterized protein n=1 Tax=Ficus carica TaxID=3494 RepID=A0AA88DVK8_FICCA|nr:hypothetical protein TIFTF001_031518 [Ficus carica]